MAEISLGLSCLKPGQETLLRQVQKVGIFFIQCAGCARILLLAVSGIFSLGKQALSFIFESSVLLLLAKFHGVSSLWLIFASFYIGYNVSYPCPSMPPHDAFNTLGTES